LPKSGKTSRSRKSYQSDRAEIPHIKQAQSLEAKLRQEENAVTRFVEMLGPGLIPACQPTISQALARLRNPAQRSVTRHGSRRG